MKSKINNINDLKLEIARLSVLKREQEGYLGDQYKLLKNKVETPSRILGAVTSNIPGVSMVKGLFSSIGNAAAGKNDSSSATRKSDWLTKAVRLGLPLILNRTVLKNSGWLKKSLVLLASEGAAGQINQDKVGSFVSKITDFIRPKKGKKKKHKDIESFDDEESDNEFGIPPNSETY